jgi:hypothetical protein
MNLSSHENFLSDILLIASDKSITIFTTSRIYDRLDDNVKNIPQYEWVLKSRNERLHEYLQRVQTWSSELDILIVFPFYGTVLDYIRFSTFNPNCEYYLYLFNINGWIGKKSVFTPKIFNYLKYPLKQSILRKVDILLVEYEPIRDYAQSYYSKLPIRSFTPVITHSPTDESVTTSGRVVITIPGMIDKSRRNYDIVLSAIENLERWQINEFEFVLLGKPIGEYGAEVIKRAEGLKSYGLVVTTFEGWIGPGEFDQYLQSSDLLINPLVRTKKVDGFIEYYGLSKGSGAIADAIRYSLPLLLPEWYNTPNLYSSGISKFSSTEDINRFLTNIVTGCRSRVLSEQTTQAKQNFGKDAQMEKLNSIYSN